MMKTKTMILALGLVAVAIASPVSATDSLQIAYSSFAAEKNNQKHPAMVTHTLTILQEMVDPRFCIAYDNTLRNNKGKGKATITVMHMDESETVLALVDQVRNHNYVKCSKTGQVEDLVPGDIVLFEVDFKNFTRLKRSESRIDRINVNSVVVANGFPLPLGTVGAIPGDEEDGKEGGWFHSTNYNFQAAKNKQKHPATASKMLVMEHDVAAPKLCFLYRNSFNKGGAGKVKSVVTTYRDDEMIESLTMKDGVNKNKSQECVDGQDLLTGDVIVWDFTFSNLPRLKKGASKVDHAEVTGVVSGNGTPDFASVAADPGNPTPDTPDPSGGLSSADLSAAAKLLVANKKVQLWRFKGDNPTKWTVVGPKTQLGDGRGGLNEATAGYGNTIAAAVADYERKMGKLASGGSLTNSDVNGLVWYSGINSSQGPTSIRRSTAGGYFGEYYRPGRGAQHEGPFGSLSKAIQWLQAQGL